MKDMRRRDLLVLLVLLGLIAVSWRMLQPPPIDNGKLTLSDDIIALFSPWHGPVERAQAQVAGDTHTGEVKGASTDQLVAEPNPPHSHLPIEHYTGAPFEISLEAMLAKLGVTINPEDVVSAFPDPRLGIGSQITVYRATPVTLIDWGKSKTYRTWQTVIGDFLTEQNIELGDNDRIDPPATTSLTGQSTLTITRVAITEIKQKEAIDFKKNTKEDAGLPRGKKKVTPGVKGERVKTIRQTRENGEIVKTELLKTETTRQPVDELTVVGTKIDIGETHTGPASWYNYNSTKIASDFYKRNTPLRITNLDNGKVIWVKSDGCICADTKYVVDLNPVYFKVLGGQLGQGVLPHVKVEQVTSDIGDLIQNK